MRKALVVVGMHRSGTSAITRVLNLLGAQISSHLILPGEDNIRGFWEPWEIVDINNRLLAVLASAWDEPLGLELTSLDTNLRQQLHEEAVSVLRRDMDASRLFVMKDPRFSRVIPFWMDVLAELEFEPCFIQALRHPSEVAASLKRRNGFAKSKSYDLWLDHNLRLRRDAAGRKCCIVRYDLLLTDWRKALASIPETFGIQWAITTLVAASVAQFLTVDERHQWAGLEDLWHPELPPEVRNLYLELSGLAAGEEQP